MIFANPPLVELMAELRWVPTGSLPSTVPGDQQTATGQFPQGFTLQFPISSPFQEETFSRFSNHVAAMGFGISERLIPPGFPALPFLLEEFREREPNEPLPAEAGKKLKELKECLLNASNYLPDPNPQIPAWRGAKLEPPTRSEE